MITALLRKSLAEAESRRSLAGPRDEYAIDAARRDHLAEAAWRDVLRRNDLSIAGPLVAGAAALAGLADPDQAPVPDLRLEAARTLAAVADENVDREDGFFAGDRTRLSARLDADPVGPACDIGADRGPATHRGVGSEGAGARRVRAGGRRASPVRCGWAAVTDPAARLSSLPQWRTGQRAAGLP